MTDLFSTPELIPDNVSQILDKYPDIDSYEECEALKKELETVGYTIDYYLDAVPFDLRPINVN